MVACLRSKHPRWVRAPACRTVVWEEFETEFVMAIIDFRIRPPYKDFQGTAMYAQV